MNTPPPTTPCLQLPPRQAKVAGAAAHGKIETCKQQLSRTYNLHGQSEFSEQTSTPVFEEFICLKRVSSHSESEVHESKKPRNQSDENDKNSKKSDWLQLWYQTPDPSSEEVISQDSRGKVSVGGGGTATVPPPQGTMNRSLPPASTMFTAETGGGGNKKEPKERQSAKSARRCWSPELHNRFLQAVQQLGGSYVATPNQIRELMMVDELTNEQIKSHLQAKILFDLAGPIDR
ncbi:Transcription factor HHO3 [Sesamum alatum]|uniref:Transcription factor HHO3 n=1 Tax=Sesamum alatum TaxID=300844 RepID=A0AAE1YEL7_9LAMI|nr:Transcription factor HHO3 [Sesamum alatum]